MEAVKSKTANRPTTVQPAASLKQVQPRVTGNNSVRLQSFTPKISSPKDPAEKEANATAQKIMRMTVPDNSIAYLKTDRGRMFRQVTTEETENTRRLSLQREARASVGWGWRPGALT